MMLHKKALALALAVLSLTATNVIAEGYVGIGFGKVDTDLNSDFSDPTSIELIGGFDLNDSVSVEISYLDFGDTSDDTAPVWTGSATGVTLGLVAKAPINRDVDMFFKGGLLRWDASLSEEGAGEFASDTDVDIFFGFGINAKIDRSISVGLRYSIYSMDEIFPGTGDIDPSILSIHGQLAF